MNKIMTLGCLIAALFSQVACQKTSTRSENVSETAEARKQREEAKAKQDVEDEAKRKAEEAKAKQDAEDKAKRKAEEAKAKQDAEDKAKRKAEEAKAKQDAEDKAKRKAEEAKAKQDAEDKAKRKAEEAKAKQDAEDKAKRKAEEAKAKQDAEDKAKRKAEEAKAKQDAEDKAKRKAEEAKAKQDAEDKAKRKAEEEAKPNTKPAEPGEKAKPTEPPKANTKPSTADKTPKATSGQVLTPENLGNVIKEITGKELSEAALNDLKINFADLSDASQALQNLREEFIKKPTRDLFNKIAVDRAKVGGDLDDNAYYARGFFLFGKDEIKNYIETRVKNEKELSSDLVSAKKSSLSPDKVKALESLISDERTLNRRIKNSFADAVGNYDSYSVRTVMSADELTKNLKNILGLDFPTPLLRSLLSCYYMGTNTLNEELKSSAEAVKGADVNEKLTLGLKVLLVYNIKSGFSKKSLANIKSGPQASLYIDALLSLSQELSAFEAKIKAKTDKVIKQDIRVDDIAILGTAAALSEATAGLQGLIQQMLAELK